LAGGKNILIAENFCNDFKWCSQITAQHYSSSFFFDGEGKGALLALLLLLRALIVF